METRTLWSIIAELKRRKVSCAVLDGGRIELSGAPEDVRAIEPTVRAREADLVALIQEHVLGDGDIAVARAQDVLREYDERACEHDCLSLPRCEQEAALTALAAFLRNHPSWRFSERATARVLWAITRDGHIVKAPR